MAKGLICCLRGGRALNINKFRDANTLIFRRGGWMPSSMNNQVHEMSVNVKGTFEVDSLALKRRLEGHGILSHEAEAIINAITEVTNDALQHSSALFVTKEQLKMSEKILEINNLKFTHEINMLKDNHVSSVQRQINLLRADIEGGRIELSCAMDEATMGRHLELQSKKRYYYGELSKEISALKKRCHNIDIELHNINDHAAANKYDVIKYCMGFVLPIFVVTTAIISSCT